MLRTLQIEISKRDNNTLTATIAKQFLREPSSTNLACFSQIADAAARVLAEGEVDLELDGLKSLGDVAARALSRHKGTLQLNGLTSLSDSVAEALGQHKGPLELNSLTSLGTHAAAAIAKVDGDLWLASLARLSDAAARALGKHNKGWLVLEGIASLSDAAAQSLARQRGSLLLDGLTSLSDGAAEALARHTGELYLRGLTHLSEAAARAFANHRGYLILDGLGHLSDAAAKSLARCRGCLSLNGLESLSDAAAEALAQHTGGALYLNGLESLSAGAVQVLGQYKGDLWVHGLRNLSGAAAEVLLARDPDLTKLSGLVWATAMVAYRCRGYAHPILYTARQAGATALRSVWNGHGDDGMFEHILVSKRTLPKVDLDPEEDVMAILNGEGLTIEGNGNGSVGILEVDLVSGHSNFWGSGYPLFEDHRFAEFLMRCEWAEAKKLIATFVWSPEETASTHSCRYAINNLKFSSVRLSAGPCQEDARPAPRPGHLPGGYTLCRRAGRSLQEELQVLLERLDALESPAKEGQGLMAAVRSECGVYVRLSVDVVRRTFTFEGRERQVRIKVPVDVLKARQFDIKLGPVSSAPKKSPKVP